MSHSDSDKEEERDDIGESGVYRANMIQARNRNVFQSILTDSRAEFLSNSNRYTKIDDNEQVSNADIKTHNFKIILVGDFACGKTSLINRLLNNTGNLTTINFKEEVQKSFNINATTKVILSIFDTHGEEKYGKPTKLHYVDAHAAIVVFDLTNKQSFTNLDMWIEEVKDHVPSDCHILIVGNKMDDFNERKVTTNDINNLKKKYNYEVIETSARKGNNVELAFQELSEILIEKEEKGPPPGEEIVIRQSINRVSIKLEPEKVTTVEEKEIKKKKKKKKFKC
jgi:small GTP-binding protein